MAVISSRALLYAAVFNCSQMYGVVSALVVVVVEVVVGLWEGAQPLSLFQRLLGYREGCVRCWGARVHRRV